MAGVTLEFWLPIKLYGSSFVLCVAGRRNDRRCEEGLRIHDSFGYFLWATSRLSVVTVVIIDFHLQKK